jgi:hypothetical protein
MSTTRDQRIYAMYRAERKTFDYLGGTGPRPLLAVARRFRMPVVQVRGIVAEMRRRRAEELERRVR